MRLGEWHGIVVFITACRSKGQGVQIQLRAFLRVLFPVKNNGVCVLKKKKIHPNEMATFKKRHCIMIMFERKFSIKETSFFCVRYVK